MSVTDYEMEEMYAGKLAEAWLDGHNHPAIGNATVYQFYPDPIDFPELEGTMIKIVVQLERE